MIDAQCDHPGVAQARQEIARPVGVPRHCERHTRLRANPGYAVRINELSPAESDATLERLFAHQTQPQYRYTFQWEEGDVLMWEDIGTIHSAVPDYRPDEPRLIKRCQVMATKYVPPETGIARTA